MLSKNTSILRAWDFNLSCLPVVSWPAEIIKSQAEAFHLNFLIHI